MLQSINSANTYLEFNFNVHMFVGFHHQRWPRQELRGKIKTTVTCVSHLGMIIDAALKNRQRCVSRIILYIPSRNQREKIVRISWCANFCTTCEKASCEQPALTENKCWSWIDDIRTIATGAAALIMFPYFDCPALLDVLSDYFPVCK